MDRLMRIQARVTKDAEQCPKCGSTALLRSDSGLCERCTAVLPETIAAWQHRRESVGSRSVRLSTAVPYDWCITCLQPYGALTPRQHEARCSARPFPCDCGHRYWNPADLKAHQGYCRTLHPRQR